MREFEAVDSGYRSAMSVQSSLVIYPIYAFGSEAQKRELLPRLIRGETVGCFGLTEADGGSDPGAMRTTARAVAGGFVLNGSKMWITNSPIADLAVVWAKLDGIIRGFIVKRGDAGFSTPKITGKLSLKASITGEIALDECFIPEDRMLPGVQGLRGPFSCLNKAPLRHRLGRDGRRRVLLPRRAQLCARADRVRPAHRPDPAGPAEACQHADRDSRSGSTGHWRSRRRLDRGDSCTDAISMMKRNNCGKALDIARVARDIHGGNGIAGEYHVMRHMINLETVNTYEGTHDVHALIMGRAITGLQAFQ